MLRGLVVEGVKTFSARHEIDLSPMTLVFGPNSAGKSTVLQSLLLLKQSVELSDPCDPLLLAQGPYVDMASFTNLVSQHDRDRTIHLGVTGSVDDESPLSVGADLEYAIIDGSPRLVAVSVLFADRPRATLGRWRLVVVRDRHARDGALQFRGDDPGPDVVDWLLKVLGPRHAAAAWSVARNAVLDATPADADASVSRDDVEQELAGLDLRLVRPIADGVPVGVVPQRFVAERSRPSRVELALLWLLEQAERALVGELKAIMSIGPMRDPLPRVALAGHSVGRVAGRRGEQVLSLLAGDPMLLAQVNECIAALQIGYQLAVEPVRVRPDDLEPDDSGRWDDPVLGDVVALRFIDRDGLRSSAADVGFGVTQILPVVVQALAFPGSTVLVEQPELHLHPALQAQMADLFADAVPTTRFLLETHSEHLVLRTMTNVAEQRVGHRDVQILYVDPCREPTRHHRVRFDEDGRLLGGWPGGFFPERSQELLRRERVLAAQAEVVDT